MKTGLSGWLYAYEVPPPPPVIMSPSLSRSASPPFTVVKKDGSSKEQTPQKEKEVNPEVEGSRNGEEIGNSSDSLTKEVDSKAVELVEKKEEEETVKEHTSANEASKTDGEDFTVDTTKASDADVVGEQTGDNDSGTPVPVPADETDNAPPPSPPPSDEKQVLKGANTEELPIENHVGISSRTSDGDKGDVPLDPDDETNRISGKIIDNRRQKQRQTESPKKFPTYCSPGIHGFLFAVHRKTVSVDIVISSSIVYCLFICLFQLRMENYFISSQKNRPVLFSVPMVVPCVPSTARSYVYDSIWRQVQRLVIADPPSRDRYIHLHIMSCDN